MSELDEYADMLTRARTSASPKVLSNYSTDHARLVVKELLNLAISEKLDLSIVSGKLDGNCYDKTVLDLTEKLINCNQQVRIWVTEASPDTLIGDFPDYFRFLDKNNIGHGSFIREIPEKYRDIPHFMVVGQTAYRYEIDKESKQASLSFNDPDFAYSLYNFCNALEALI